MNTEERFEELVTTYAYDDSAYVTLARMVAELEAHIEKREEYVEFLVKELGNTQYKLESQVTCLTDMLIDRHTDEEDIEEALADCLR